MARAERAALANMRAMEEQNFREEAHSNASGGGMYGGSRFIGAGATPSMGLSEFRGGRKGAKCNQCHRKKCVCEESSSDEEMEGGNMMSRVLAQMEKKAPPVRRANPGMEKLVPMNPTRGLMGRGKIGGAAPAGMTYRAFAPRVGVPYRGTSGSTAIVPFRPAVSRGRAPVGPLVPYVPRPTVRTPTTLTVKPSGAIKPYNAAEAQFRINNLKPTSKSTMGSRARILAGLAATGIALGLSGVALSNYIAEQANANAGPSGGPAEPPVTETPVGRPNAPIDPTIYDDGGDGGVYYPDGGDAGAGDGMSSSDLAWYLQTGNLPDTAYTSGRKGSGKGRSDGRSARAAVVRKVMREKGMSMIEASKYVKANNLY